MTITALRACRITQTATHNEGRDVWWDERHNLPYTWISFERKDDPAAGMFIYLTPCCFAAATASDPDWGIYCKVCYRNVDGLCGTGPDNDEPAPAQIHRVRRSITAAIKRAESAPLAKTAAYRAVLKEKRAKLAALDEGIVPTPTVHVAHLQRWLTTRSATLARY